MDYQTAKRCFNRIVAVCIVAAAAFLLCIGTCMAGGILTNEAYTSFTDISPATELAQRKASYLRAIRLCPDRSAAYIRLLETYGEDGIYTKAESEEFLTLYNRNHEKLPPSRRDNAQLYTQIALLYINGYEDSTVTRLRLAQSFLNAAQPHLEEGDPSQAVVDCYCQITRYYSDYIWNISATNEVSTEVFRTSMDSIRRTLDSFRQQGGQANMYDKFGFCVAVCDLFYDQRELIASMIPKEDVFSILDTIYGDLPAELTLQKEQTRVLYQTLKDNEESYRDMLERAYRRAGGEENGS